MASSLTDIATRLKVLEAIIKGHTDSICKQELVINELKKEISSGNNQNKENNNLSAYTPIQTNRNKRPYSSVLWSEIMQTPVTHSNTDASESVNKRRRIENREKNVKSNNLFKDKEKYERLLVIKPNDIDSDMNDMKSDIKKIVNPKDDPVKTIRTTAKGNIILKCNDKESLEIVKNKLLKSVSDKYSVDTPKQVSPQIKLVGLDENIPENELVLLLKKQNPYVISESAVIQVKDIKLIQTKSYTYYTVIITTDCDTFKNIMSRGKLNIMWSRVKCYQILPDNRCYKCQSLSHLSINCTEKDFVCPKCSGNHKGKDCESQELKCHNCQVTESEEFYKN